MAPIFDAHCHLQDDRLSEALSDLEDLYADAGVECVVVNGTSPADWRKVKDLADRFTFVRPSYGLHPWEVNTVEAGWEEVLLSYLKSTKTSGLGEIGLDRWIKDYDMPAQERAFVAQLEIAVERDLPVSIHCLQAWGRMLDVLKEHRTPRRGFLLHSYGGSSEMIERFSEIGAYFSISGYFARDRKTKQRDALKQIPIDRLLIETDAPDMKGPSKVSPYSVKKDSSANHPMNIAACYSFVAELFDLSLEDLKMCVQANFYRLFR